MGGLVSKGPSPGTVKTSRRFMDISTTLVMLRASCALAGMMSHIGDSGLDTITNVVAGDLSPLTSVSTKLYIQVHYLLLQSF